MEMMEQSTQTEANDNELPMVESKATQTSDKPEEIYMVYPANRLQVFFVIFFNTVIIEF